MNKSGRVACPRCSRSGGKPLFLTCSILCCFSSLSRRDIHGAQIGGLSVATFVTLLVPVIYAIFVLDLKLVKWEKTEEATPKASHVTA